jgi:septal ring factor EnvC (AmiA/AmiB activator)
VHQLETELAEVRSELASRGHGQSELWQERSELIDDKAHLGRQIAELSKRTQRAEADLATSRAAARAMANNNEDLQQQLAKQTNACQKLEQRCALSCWECYHARKKSPSCGPM